MPQLDLMSFFSQFFWFSLNFCFFYLFLLYCFLPKISLNIKARKRLLNLFAKDINIKKNSISDLLIVYDKLLLKALIFFRFYISKVLFFCDSWLQLTLNKINLSSISICNIKYVKIISERELIIFVLYCLLKNK